MNAATAEGPNVFRAPHSIVEDSEAIALSRTAKEEKRQPSDILRLFIILNNKYGKVVAVSEQLPNSVLKVSSEKRI